MGHPRSLVTRFFDGAEQDPKVIQADRRQGVFQKDFITESHVDSNAQPQFSKIKAAKKLTRG